jgi:hypothetical protein
MLLLRELEIIKVSNTEPKVDLKFVKKFWTN